MLNSTKSSHPLQHRYFVLFSVLCQPYRHSATQFVSYSCKVKVKQSHYRPWQALRVPGVWGSQILRQSAHEGGKVASPTHQPHLPQEIFLVLIYGRSWVDPRAILRPEGLCQWNFPMTPLGIEPANFRFVAQCPNHCATAYPTPIQ
jgi:hypothetical protein